MIWRTICRNALKFSGLAPDGQVATPELMQSAETALGNMLSRWSLEGLLVPGFESTSTALIGGQLIYTMGDSGDFARRPLNIQQCILSGSNLGQVRYINIIRPWDEFEALTFPQAQGLPNIAYFNPTYPQAQVAFNLTPNQNWTIKFVGTFPWEAVNLNDTISVPPGYEPVITDNLACEVGDNNTYKVPQVIRNRARDGKSSIRLSIPPKDQTRNNVLATTWMAGKPYNWQTDSWK